MLLIEQFFITVRSYFSQQDSDAFASDLQFIEDDDIIVLTLDANDAPSTVTKSDISYMVSSVLNGFRKNTVDESEQEQFLNDLHRCPTIKFDDSPILTDEQRNNLQGAGTLLFLSTTSAAIANRTRISSQQVINGISLLNQSLGNQVLTILHKYIESFRIAGDVAIGFRVLQRDINYQDEFNKSGDVFSKTYNLPIRIMTEDRNSDLYSSSADFEVHVSLCIDFSLPEQDPNRVNYRMQITKLNPELRLDLPDFDGYGAEDHDWLVVKLPKIKLRT